MTMPTGEVEMLLYDLGNSKQRRKTYNEDREAFLKRYRVSASEAQMVANEDVEGLLRLGLNPMLVMGFYMGLHGSRSMPEYLAQAPTLESCLIEWGMSR
tara:strand:- start:6539 stop:6835 length:297 start_codon:yes stop_codon:yes gene_type:complete